MKKIVGSVLELSAKALFLLDKYQFKDMGWNLRFCYSTYREWKKFYWSAFPHVTKLILLHTVVVLHYTHHIKMAWLVRGKAAEMLKNNLL